LNSLIACALRVYIKNYARCTHEIKFRIAMAKAAFSEKKAPFTSRLYLNLRKKLEKCNVWNIVLCGAETWTLQEVEQNYIESFEMWCWRRIEKIRWANCVKSGVVVHGVKEERNVLCTINEQGMTGFVTYCVGTAF
jgi:hypothetical protein